MCAACTCCSLWCMVMVTHHVRNMLMLGGCATAFVIQHLFNSHTIHLTTHLVSSLKWFFGSLGLSSHVHKLCCKFLRLVSRGTVRYYQLKFAGCRQGISALMPTPCQYLHWTCQWLTMRPCMLLANHLAAHSFSSPALASRQTALQYSSNTVRAKAGSMNMNSSHNHHKGEQTNKSRRRNQSATR